MMHTSHQVIEIKLVNLSDGCVAREKGGIKFEGKSTEVIENKYRKNDRYRA